jgi:hypothetical protein
MQGTLDQTKQIMMTEAGRDSVWVSKPYTICNADKLEQWFIVGTVMFKGVRHI